MTRFSSCFATLAMVFGAAATAAGQIQLPVPLRAAPTSDITALLDARSIEVEVHGSGIRSVTIRLRRLAPGAVTVRVPVGTYFLSRGRAAQNMVATDPAERVLDTAGWVTLVVNAACANRARSIPVYGDRFTVRRSPPQADLTRLLPRLRSAAASYATTQAAVWIVTDDADYDELGILVNQSRTQVSAERQIREAEAGEAMRVVGLAGVELRTKAIWNDRDRIFWRLNEGLAREWLRTADSALARREAEAVQSVSARLAGPSREIRNLARIRLRVFIGVGSANRAPLATGVAAFLRGLGHDVQIGSLGPGTSQLTIRFQDRSEPAARDLGRILSLVFAEAPRIETLARTDRSIDRDVLVGIW